jgi:hypothetical protein
LNLLIAASPQSADRGDLRKTPEICPNRFFQRRRNRDAIVAASAPGNAAETVINGEIDSRDWRSPGWKW